MAIPYLLDPNSRPGNRLLNAATPGAYIGGIMDSIAPPPQMPQANAGVRPPMAPAGLVQVPEEKPGILGRIGSALANPAVNQRLMALGSELLANSGYQTTPVTTGAGLGRGLMAMNQAGMQYDQMIAQQAADRLNKRLTEAQIAKAEREAKGGDARYGKGAGVGVNPETGKPEVYQLSDSGSVIWTGVAPAESFTYQDLGGEVIGAGKYGGQGPQYEKGVSPDVKEKEAQKVREEQRAPDVAAATVTAEETARASAAKDATRASQAEGAGDMLAVVDRIEKLLPGASQNAISGGWKAALSEYGGIATDSRVIDRRLQLLGTELVAEQAKSKILGANPTEGERQTYVELVGKIQAPGPIEERLAAVDELRRRWERLQAKGQKKPQGAPAAKPAGKKPLVWNPATGRVE